MVEREKSEERRREIRGERYKSERERRREK